MNAIRIDKARKELEVIADQRQICSEFAKNFLTDFKENTIETLVDMNMMETKAVVPWLR